MGVDDLTAPAAANGYASGRPPVLVAGHAGKSHCG